MSPFPQNLNQEKILYSLGTSQRSLCQFLNLFHEYHLQTGVDIRSFPTSRFPHFSKEALARSLEVEGIEYVYLGRELGGFRKGGYPNYMKSEAFKIGLERLEEFGKRKRTVFFCSERFPWRCHRRWVAGALVQRGWSVIHIIESGKVWIPGNSGSNNKRLDFKE